MRSFFEKRLEIIVKNSGAFARKDTRSRKKPGTLMVKQVGYPPHSFLCSLASLTYKGRLIDNILGYF